MAAVTIREMELEDLPPVYALGERLFTSERWPNLYRTWDVYELVDMFSSDSETCLVAESKAGRIVGFALGTVIEKRRSAWTYGYIVWLGVDRKHSGRKVGQRLLAKLTELFVEQGARLLLVDTDSKNEAALRFFRKQGFGHRREHVYLTKNLTHHESDAGDGKGAAKRRSGDKRQGKAGKSKRKRSPAKRRKREK